MKGRRFHLLIGVMLLLSSGISWLMHSHSALLWAWSRVEALSGGAVKAEQVEGVLAGPITLHGLELDLPDVKITLSHGRFDWHAGRLLMGRLHATELSAGELVVTLLPSAAETEQTGATETAFTGLAAPLATTIDHLSLARLVIRDGEEEILHFDNIVIDEAYWQGEQLWLRQLDFDSPWAHLNAHGHLATRLDGAANLETTLRLNRQWWDSDLQASGRVHGTLGQPQLDMQLSGALQGQLKGLIVWAGGPLHWQASADLQPFTLRQLQPQWRALQLAGHLEGEGDFVRNRLRGTVNLADPLLGRWRGSAALIQDWAQIEVEQARLDGVGHAGHLEGHGKVRLVDAPDYLADAQIELKWRKLGWPVAAKSPPWFSEQGEARLNGGLRDYRLVGDFHLALPNTPPFRARLDGRGDLDHLASEALQLEGLGGSASGAASVTWSPEVSWQARLLGKGLNPGSYWAGWPGRVDLDIASDGRWGKREYLALDLHSAQGELQGRSLRARGKVAYEQGQWRLGGLDLQSGAAHFTADGTLAVPWNVTWQLDVPRLGQLLKSAHGALHLEGEVKGEESKPQIAVRGEARALQWEVWQLQRGSLDALVDLAGSTPWRLRLALGQLRRNDQLLADSLSLQGDGTAAAHTLSLSFAHGEGRFSQRLEGAYHDGEWHAQLLNGRWRNPAGEWQQEAAAQLSLSSRTLSLTPLCWRSGTARACLASSSLADGSSDLTASLKGLPMSLFSPWVPRSDVTLGGELSAEGHLRWREGVREVSLEAHTSEATLNYKHPLQTIDLHFATGRLSLRSASQGTRASADLVLSNGDAVHLEQALPGWLIGEPLAPAQVVSGKARLTMHDLSWLTIFVPEIVQPHGTVTAQLNLGGTVDDPRLTGSMGLSDGSVVIPRAGVSVTQLGVLASSPDGVTLQFSGAARSGPGWVTLEGKVVGETLEKWRSELKLRGDRFEVVRLPSLHLLASPDVQVAIEPHRVDLDGRLTIPEAEIKLPDLPTTVQSSSDVVLVNSGTPEAPPQKWRINSHLTLALGDYIRVEGYGFKGRVAGLLTLTERPDEPATGQGELTVPEGRYRAYGQDLTVEYGRMLFANSLLDNPALDVRASRSIKEVKVGVNITGRLQRPELRLFSEPAMEDSDALSYLVLGQPLSSASSSEAGTVSAAATSLGLVGGEQIAKSVGDEFGIDEVSLGTEYGSQNAALLLGKYLSPRLYVQYAVVFSDALNITRLRYELANHWYFKAESGEQQSADILYTFER